MKKITAVAILILMLTHPVISLNGARQGLLLWSQTVLPTLLPFMICSNVIVAIGALPLIMTPLRPIFRHVFHLTDDGGYVLLSGLLCGYPIGAKTCGEFLAQGRISPKEARYLLAVSNHPSPMFVLGYLAANLDHHFPISWMLPALYLPILPLSLGARHLYGISKPTDIQEPTLAAASIDSPPLTFDDIMMRSIEVMVRIGGYIMLFSILAQFIEYTPVVPASFKAILLGLAEITTGIHAVSLVFRGQTQGIILAGITAFGGLSGIFQTRSVLPGIKNAGLSIRHYILWKMIHAFMACLLATVPGILPALLPGP